MADWAIFAKIIADTLEIAKVEDLLEMMETERATFALENENWAAIIGEWVSDQPEDAATWRKAGSLADRLNEVADDYDRPFPISSPQGMGSKLSHYQNELSELYNLEIDDGSRSKRYRFNVADDTSPSVLDRF